MRYQASATLQLYSNVDKLSPVMSSIRKKTESMTKKIDIRADRLKPILVERRL